MKKNLIKSPLNYTGGKYRLLPQILPLFPEKINVFYDVFGGGGNVSLNVGANSVYYNDIISYIGAMFSKIKNELPEESLKKVLDIVNKYELSLTNEGGFKKLRDDYNNGKNDWEYFYSLITHSFNYQIRFNNNHEYNSSFGRNRSSFNPALQKRFVSFCEKLSTLDIQFSNKDFRDIDYSKIEKNDLVYFDPPYLIGLGVYQDGKRGFKGWSSRDEKDLYDICDKLHSRGIRFAISNVLESKGNKNDSLIEWSKNYNISYLNADYSNSSYQKQERSKKDIEVLITNY